MDYNINDTNFHYDAGGERQYGENVVLLNSDIDLTIGTSWQKDGFTIEKLFSAEIYTTFAKNTHALLVEQWAKSGLMVPEDFKLDQYHVLAANNLKHMAAVEFTKIIPVEGFPVAVELLEKRISEICGTPLIVRNPFDKQSIFHFRVIRPQLRDNNPLHRDVWLEDYKDCINLYIPVAGSDENSSLIVIPGSHYWPESRVERTSAGAEINGIRFNVPAVTHITGDCKPIRPTPQLNEVLVFSPYLIHGGSMNLNENTTRISIEVRLWKK